MNTPLAILIAVFVIALVVGVGARRGRKMGAEEWAVSSHNLPTVLVFLLLAGEMFSTFTFLGAPSWSFSHGVSASFILAYLAIGSVVGFWLLPPIWRYATRNHILSEPDFLASKFDSRALRLLVSLVGVVAMLPYVVLQLKGLKIITELTSYGTLNGTVAVWIGAGVVTLYVMTSGVRGSAWVSVFKDIVLLGVAIGLGVYLPIHLYGSLGAMFTHVSSVAPERLVMKAPNGPVWFVSTVALLALGFYMWPQQFTATCTARHERSLRKSLTYLPLYGLLLLFVFFIGFSAVGLVHVDNPNLVVMTVSIKTLSPWVVGIVGGAGLLAALVPASMLLTVLSTLASETVLHYVHADAKDRLATLTARLCVPAFALIAVYLTFHGDKGIVALLLLGYSYVTQLFPPIVGSLLPRPFGTKYGAISSIVVGLVFVTVLTFNPSVAGSVLWFLPEWSKDINTGVLALVANAIVFVAVSMGTGRLCGTDPIATK